MQYRRRKPDVFEIMAFARTHVFVRRDARHYLLVSALQHGFSIIYFRRGTSEPLRIEYMYDEQQCIFVDGAWDLPALIKWLKSRENYMKIQIEATVDDELRAEFVEALRNLICDLRALGAEVNATMQGAQFEAFCDEEDQSE